MCLRKFLNKLTEKVTHYAIARKLKHGDASSNYGLKNDSKKEECSNECYFSYKAGGGNIGNETF